MSGDYFQTLYASYQAATTTTPTAGAVILNAGLPPVVVPANFLNQLGSQSGSLRLKMGGQMTTTATIPTWLFGLQFSSANSFQTVSAANTLVATAATAPATAATGAWWDAEFDIGLRTIAQGAASTVSTTGMVRGSSLNAAALFTAPATNVASTNSNWDIGQQYYLWPYLTLGAATAGNTVTLQYLKLWGEN